MQSKLLSQDQAFADLQSKVPYDASRDAINSIRGYDWQRWLTILNWVELKGEECLWIEWGEDFTVVGEPDGLRTIQAKSSAAPISLGSKSVLDLIEAAFSRPSGVQTVIWTCAVAGLEKNTPFVDGAIAEWQRVQQRQVDGKALKLFLLGVPAASKDLKKILTAAHTEEQIRDLVGKVRWVMGEQDASGIKIKVMLALETRLAALNVVAPSLKRELFCNLLFEYVGRMSIQRNAASRKLSRVGLDEWIGTQIAAIIGAVAVERYNRALQLLDGPARRNESDEISSLEPFTLPWYVYSERSVSLIGRNDELSRMQRFLDEDQLFLIQLLGGEAGTGKSRLALEFMRGLDSCWLRGFLRAADLSDLLTELPMSGGHVFVAIDYAGSSPQEIRWFIDRAEREAVRHRVKIRLLLIERDVTEKAEWRRSISEGLTRGAAAFQRAHHAEPIVIDSVHGLDLDVLRAWMEAANFGASAVDALTKETKDEIARVCHGNPLLLGFAAAALANGDNQFFDVANLLDGLLRREFSKFESSEMRALLEEEVVGVAAVATSARFDLSKPHDEDVFLAKTKQGVGVYVVEDSDRKKRLLTIGDIRGSQQYSVLQRVLANHGERVTVAIARAFSAKSPTTLVRASQRAFGRSCIVQPDLVGEYFLAMHWSRPNAFRDTILAGTEDHADRHLRPAENLSQRHPLPRQ